MCVFSPSICSSSGCPSLFSPQMFVVALDVQACKFVVALDVQACKFVVALGVQACKLASLDIQSYNNCWGRIHTHRLEFKQHQIQPFSRLKVATRSLRLSRYSVQRFSRKTSPQDGLTCKIHCCRPVNGQLKPF